MTIFVTYGLAQWFPCNGTPQSKKKKRPMKFVCSVAMGEFHVANNNNNNNNDNDNDDI